MVLLCLSDIHGEGSGLTDALSSSPEADVVVICGDITHLGGYAEARSILEPLMESGKRLIAIPGNMDGEGVRRFLDEKGIGIHGRGVAIGGTGFLGLGGSNPSPFGTPFEVAPVDAERLLQSGLAEVGDAGFKVLVSHAPPRGTKLDRSFAGMHVGSAEVRRFVESGAVDLCLCGHIHESAGEDTLGGVCCLNIGPFKTGRYALVRIEGREIQVHWRTK